MSNEKKSPRCPELTVNVYSVIQFNILLIVQAKDEWFKMFSHDAGQGNYGKKKQHWGNTECDINENRT